MNFDSQKWCASVAKWFHLHGIAWSGTPSELAAELSSAGVFAEFTSEFSDANEIVAELEANAEVLRATGVEVTAQRTPGRVRTVSLRRNGARFSSEPEQVLVEAEEVRSTPMGGELEGETLDASHEASEEENRIRTVYATESTVSMMDLGSPEAETIAAGYERLEMAGADEPATVHFMPEQERSVLPLGVAALIGLVAVAVILGFAVDRNGAFASVVRRAESQPATSTPNDSGVEARASNDIYTSEILEGGAATAARTSVDQVSRAAGKRNPSKRAADPEVQRLMQEAPAERAASQYELGMRYAEGRGVPADKVVAYAWLVVALNNGETRSDAVLQSLGPRLSVLDVQRIRLTLGEWYAQGHGVAKDPVTAHKWFSLAEVAGSAEGTLRKKRLEEQMTAEEIQQAEEKTTAWLSRH